MPASEATTAKKGGASKATKMNYLQFFIFFLFEVGDRA
jgi:hypothetical protein